MPDFLEKEVKSIFNIIVILLYMSTNKGPVLSAGVDRVAIRLNTNQ